MELGDREVLQSEEAKMAEETILNSSVRLTKEVCLNCGV